MPRQDLLVLRHGSSPLWQSTNPVLAEGEVGVISTGDGHGVIKVGDGLTGWNELPGTLSSGSIIDPATGLILSDLLPDVFHEIVDPNTGLVNTDLLPDVYHEIVDAGTGKVKEELANIPSLADMGSEFNTFYVTLPDNGDPTNLQNALNLVSALGGGKFILKPGNYVINGTLLMQQNTHLDLTGCYIKQVGATRIFGNLATGDTTYSAYEGPGNFSITGGILDMNDVEGGNAMSFMHCQTVRVHATTVRNVVNVHAAEVDAVKGWWFTDCIFEGFRDSTADQSRSHSEAIQVSTSTNPQNNCCSVDGWVLNCITRPYGSNGAFGHLVGSHAVAPMATDPGDYRQTYDNITVRDCKAYSPLYGLVHMNGWTNSNIDSNYAEHCGHSALWLEIGDNQSVDSENISIAWNTFRDSVATEAVISCGLHSSAGTAQFVDLEVSHNYINGNIGHGIAPGSCNRGVIENNVISNVAVTVSIGANSSGIQVLNNRFSNCTAANGLYSNAPYTWVEGNKFSSCGTTTVIAMSSASQCRVVRNFITALNPGTQWGVRIYGTAGGPTLCVNNDMSNTALTVANMAVLANTITKWDGTTNVLPGDNLVHS